MQRITFFETIDPAVLDPDTLAKRCQELYGVNCQIFDGVDIIHFKNKVLFPDAKWTKIRIFKTNTGQAVGYCALHGYEKVINAKKIIIFRTQTGILRDYRKQGYVSPFFLKEVIKYKAFNPFKKSYLFCTLVHPSSYHLISKFFFRYYPNRKHATPPDELDRMSLIADLFHEVQLPNFDPSLREVGWITKQTVEEQKELANSSDPDTRFFLKKNPDYDKGLGLITLVPLRLENLLISSLIFSYSLVTQFIHRTIAIQLFGRD
ncbi:MAG TPA: hypothetical protein VIS54_05690 [Psychromonas sp.]